jgi:hypothetical protein
LGDYATQKETEDPIAFATSQSDPDTLYYNQAMQADDATKFKAAMVKEAKDHTSRGHWEVWEKQNIPKGQDIHSAVWAFKCKHRIDLCAMYKHKASLNIHSDQ